MKTPIQYLQAIAHGNVRKIPRANAIDIAQAALAAPQLTDDELYFLLNEITASLDCGADHPLFELVSAKLRAARAMRILESDRAARNSSPQR